MKIKTINTLRLVSPIPPSVNHYTKVRAFMKNGRPLASVYETTEAKNYKRGFIKHIQEEIQKQGFNHIPNETQHFYVDAVFYFDRTDKDSSNYDKCLLDAITDTKLVWLDDNVALFRAMAVYYDSANPRIELTIYPTKYTGVFDSLQDKENFIQQQCEKCKRFKGGICSIYKKACEGRVQPEVTKNKNNDFCCEKCNVKMEVN